MMLIAGEKSGREDLNLRPPAPEAGALAGLRYAPSLCLLIIPYSDGHCQINVNFRNIWKKLSFRMRKFKKYRCYRRFRAFRDESGGYVVHLPQI